MPLKLASYIDLPAHRGPGGFDHAAIHRASAQLFVAHTANDALDVIDCRTDRYVHSITGLNGVAGAPGVIDVIDTATMCHLETVPTERGAKTTALDIEHDKLYVFLPESHRAAVLTDS